MNFRRRFLKENKVFNPQTRNAMNKVLNCLHEEKGQFEDFQRCLGNVFTELEKYYDNGKRPAWGESSAMINQYLHSLIYYICHNQIKHDKPFLLRYLIENFYFVPTTTWVDPETGFTALQSLAKNNQLSALSAMFEKVTSLEMENSNEFRDAISHHDDDGFSILTCSCSTLSETEDGYEVVKLLLEKAALVFGGLNSEGFIQFISRAENAGFTPLINACKQGHLAVVELLLEKAAEAFGGRDNDRFRQFICQPNKDGFSPLNSACKQGNPAVVELLLKNAAEAFGGQNSDAFRQFISHCDTHRFTSLNSACKAGHEEIVDILLRDALAAIPSNDDFYKFIDQPSKLGFTPSNNVSTQARLHPERETVFLAIEFKLQQHGASPTIKNKTGLDAIRNAPASWRAKGGIYGRCFIRSLKRKRPEKEEQFRNGVTAMDTRDDSTSPANTTAENKKDNEERSFKKSKFNPTLLGDRYSVADEKAEAALTQKPSFLLNARI